MGDYVYVVPSEMMAEDRLFKKMKPWKLPYNTTKEEAEKWLENHLSEHVSLKCGVVVKATVKLEVEER